MIKKKISYKKFYPPMLFNKDGSRAWVWLARYKKVFMQVAEWPDRISIYEMISGNPGKGECQDMIRLLKKDFPGRIVYGSVPMNKTAKHIFDKHKILYTYDEEVLANS